ncbi:MAG: acyltransferase [Oscillospiraceae bacterium]|jgi:acetyltransferase-like isoleucine patch superfamily enzyme|nr:acyltransferase [Oscillospiraceae bacterium]
MLMNNNNCYFKALQSVKEQIILFENINKEQYHMNWTVANSQITELKTVDNTDYFYFTGQEYSWVTMPLDLEIKKGEVYMYNFCFKKKSSHPITRVFIINSQNKSQEVWRGIVKNDEYIDAKGAFFANLDDANRFMFTSTDFKGENSYITFEKIEFSQSTLPVTNYQGGQIYGENNNIIKVTPNSVLKMGKNSKLIVAGKLVLGFGTCSGHETTVLQVRDNGTMIVNGTFHINFGSYINIFGGTLTVGGGMLGRNSNIYTIKNTVIGNNFLSAANTHITDTSNHKIFDMTTGERISVAKRPITIGQHVWLGLGTSILKDVNIGHNSVIGARSVVTKNVPSHCIAVGNPAKVIKENIDWKA